MQYLGYNQEKIMRYLKRGKKYTTREVLDGVFPELYRTDSLHSTVYTALARLEKKKLVKTEITDGPETKYNRKYKEERPRKKIRVWWIEL